MVNQPERIRRTVQALVTDGEVGLGSARSTVAILAALVQAGLTKSDIQMLELIVEDVAAREPHKAWDDYLTDLFNDGNQSFTWRLGAGTAGGAAMATDAFAGPTHLANELVLIAGMASALALLGGGVATVQQRLKQRDIPARRILGHQYLHNQGYDEPQGHP